MKLLIENETRRVILMFDEDADVKLNTSQATAPDMIVAGVSTDTHKILNAAPPPAPLVFVAGALAYNDGWYVYDDASYTQLKDAAVEAQATKVSAEILATASLRVEALATAIAYGNRITQGEINQWAGVEPFSWTQQRDEAKVVRDGGTLGEDAILPGLAEDKGIKLEEYADDVWANAMRYQAVLRAAVYLRRTATNTLTDPALDTPEKIAEAVAALTVEADALASQLLGGEG